MTLRKFLSSYYCIKPFQHDPLVFLLLTVLFFAAATTCWYQHAHWGPVYGGNLSVTEDGEQCQPWALNYPQTKNLIYEPDSMYPSDNDNKTAASNYCRIFDDDYTSVWCYWNQPSSFLGLRKFSDCNVPQCGSVEGQRLP